MNPHTDIPTDVPTDVPGDIPTAAPTADPAAFTTAVPYTLQPTTTAQFQLRRSRTDRMLGGVCGGLAESLGADAALLRVLVVALTLLTGGAAALVYLAAWALAPEGGRPAV